MDDRIKQIATDRMQAALDRHLEKALFGAMTNTVPEPSTTLNVETMLEECRKLLFNSRRNQLTIQVDAAHEGPPLKHSTPSDGDVVEMSYSQICALHEQWPMKLHKVHSEDRADFVPASQFDRFILARLPGPPWEVPPEETFEEWMSNIELKQE